MTTPGTSSPASSYQPLANALADRYRIERALGQGGMATVYRARSATTRQLVLLQNWNVELAGRRAR